MATRESILQSIRSNPKIPAPSEAVFQVLELTKQPDCNIKLVADVISRDAGLTAQLLRQANSALYGFSSTTSSVGEACMRLGLKRVRSAVINQHVVNGLGKARPPGFKPKEYWQSALASSVAAEEIAKRLKAPNAEDVRTAGLMCDIGVGLLAYGVVDLYKTVLTEVSSPSSPDLGRIERRVLGITHAEVGAEILADWGIESLIVNAVRQHDVDPMSPEYAEMDRFSQFVASGVTLSRIALEGSDMEAVKQLFMQISVLTDAPDQLVADLLDVLVDHIQKTAHSLNVDVGPLDDMQANFEDLARDMPDVSGKIAFRPMARNDALS